ncbi:helix-hairpin-helix domain-containing protein [Rhodococcus sp. NPDC058505]|uniref:helix-hairpin-helix domain-containing protein n=1 Tax=unclassified Rhodococcus (in: high G+C Gram-positive bacteria) TaxID=192944 RepID=UPI003647D8D2
MGSADDTRERIRRRLDVLAGREPAAEPDPDAGTGVGAGERPGWLDDEREPGGERWRFAPGRRGVVALAVVALAAAGIGGVVVVRDRPVAEVVAPLPPDDGAGAPAAAGAAPGPSSTGAPAPTTEIVVSVVGLVHNSGLVHLPEGARVADALTAAGGARDGADLLGLNLAQRLADGEQILVGLAPPPGAAPVAGSATVGAGAGAGAGAAVGGAAAPVNLNTATEQQLDELPGVGPVTAAAIISWRTTNGRFTDVEQLGEVDGIGPARLEKLRELVTAR